MIQEILNRSPHAQVVMICGKNKDLKRSLSSQFKANDNVLILGYTKHMNEWMASSHLMITKPGGITISEALTRQIPMIFLDPAPGQELENAVYFEEKGFGSIALTPEAAIEQVATLTNEPTKLATMSQAMDSSRIPYSTYKLCKDLLNLLNHSSRYEEGYGKVPLYAKLFVK